MNVFKVNKTNNQEIYHRHNGIPPHGGEKSITVLVHIDTYRLKDARELVDIGALDFLGQPGVVTIIEWPEKVEELLEGKDKIKITLEHGTGDERMIKIED